MILLLVVDMDCDSTSFWICFFVYYMYQIKSVLFCTVTPTSFIFSFMPCKNHQLPLKFRISVASSVAGTEVVHEHQTSRFLALVLPHVEFQSSYSVRFLEFLSSFRRML
jgi:hypothetical protein